MTAVVAALAAVIFGLFVMVVAFFFFVGRERDQSIEELNEARRLKWW